MDGCLCVWMGSPGDDLWLTPAPHLPSGLGQSLMLIKGWLLAKRLKGCGVLAAGVESADWLFAAPMMFVLYWSLDMVGLVLVLRGRPVGVARVVHPLRCTRGQGGHCRTPVWCPADNLKGLRLIVVAVPIGLSR